MKRGWLLLVVGLLVYVVGHIAFEGALRHGRTTFWETDDNYHFLVKAEANQHCLHDACPALQDIYNQAQLEQTEPGVAFRAIQVAHRSLIQYHPLHSLGVQVFEHAGLTPENALTGWNMVLHTLFGLCAAFFLARLFGVPAAGIGMLLLSVLWFSPSTFVMTPYVMCGAFILLAWGLLLGQGPWRFPLAFMALACAIGSHLAGIILSVITAVWVLMADYDRLRPSHGLFVLAVAAVAVMAVLFPITFVHGHLNVATLYAEHSLRKIIADNLLVLRGLLKPLAEQMGLGMLLMSAVAAPCLLEGLRRRVVVLLMGALTASIVCNLLYPSPFISLLERILPAFVVFLTGAWAALAVWVWGQVRGLSWRRLMSIEAWHFWQGKRISVKVPVLPLMLTPVMLFTALYATGHGLAIIATAQRTMHAGKDATYPLKTLQTLMSEAKPGQSILYVVGDTSYTDHADEMQEAVLYDAIVHGADRLGAVVSPLVDAHARQLSNTLSKVTWVLRANPWIGVDPLGADPFVKADEPLVLSVPQAPAEWQLYLFNPGGLVTVTANGQTVDVLPGSHWVTLPVVAGTKSVKLTAVVPLRVWGVRLDSVQKSYWPWQAGLTLEQRQSHITLDQDRLIPTPGCRVSEIVADMGALVLGRAACQNTRDQGIDDNHE